MEALGGSFSIEVWIVNRVFEKSRRSEVYEKEREREERERERDMRRMNTVQIVNNYINESSAA